MTATDIQQLTRLAQFYWPAGMGPATTRDRETERLFSRTAATLRAAAAALTARRSITGGTVDFDPAEALTLAETHWPADRDWLDSRQREPQSVSVVRRHDTAVTLRAVVAELSAPTADRSTDPIVPDYRPRLFRTGDWVEYIGTAPSKLRTFAGKPTYVVHGGWNTVYVSGWLHTIPVKTRHLRFVCAAGEPSTPEFEARFH
jgi:hypothetical protein